MSDLHVGEGLFRRELLDAAIRETNELAPDVVVIAGDLTMEGYRGELEECRRYGSPLRAPGPPRPRRPLPGSLQWHPDRLEPTLTCGKQLSASEF